MCWKKNCRPRIDNKLKKWKAGCSTKSVFGIEVAVMVVFSKKLFYKKYF
jgi:hypothetical protein